MKLRWRILTRDEVEAGKVRGAVTVARTEHYSEHCVLEWQAEGQTAKDFWQPVEMARPSQSDAGVKP